MTEVSKPEVVESVGVADSNGSADEEQRAAQLLNEIRSKKIRAALEELNDVLQAHKLGLAPVVTITPQGIVAKISVTLEGAPTGVEMVSK